MEQSATYQTKTNKFVIYLVLMLPVIKYMVIQLERNAIAAPKLICWLWLIMSLSSSLSPPHSIAWLLLIKNRMRLSLVCNVT